MSTPATATQPVPTPEEIARDVRTLAACDALSREIAAAWGAGRLTDADAQARAEAVETRRRIIRPRDVLAVRAPGVKSSGRASHFPPRRPAQKSPDRAKSIARRRALAASGLLPPQHAARFTAGEQAALAVVGEEILRAGRCVATVAEIAARAGVCAWLARRAIRQAAALGLVTIEERRRKGAPNDSNIVRIVDKAWVTWLARRGTAQAARGGIACEKTKPTHKQSFTPPLRPQTAAGTRMNSPSKGNRRERS